jgi:hypothetical protein
MTNGFLEDASSTSRRRSRTSICSPLDRPLAEAVAPMAGLGHATALARFGKHWGSQQMALAGPRGQREHCPSCGRSMRKGNRRDFVEFHPGLSR